MATASPDDSDRYPYTRDTPRITYVRPGDSPFRNALIDIMERLFGREELQRIYERIKSEPFDPRRFFARALESAGIGVRYDPGPEAAIPRDGPLIFIANHPFGVVDGAILCDLAARTRGEFKILIHAMLCQDADLASCFLPVDFDVTPAARRTNIRTRHAALDTLERRGTLVVYPSGGVSTAARCGFGKVMDLPWTPFVAKLVHQSRATVVPVFFHGSNSRTFQVLSHVHLTLRTGLLLREARRQFGKTVHMAIGQPIAHASVAHLESRRRLTEYLHRKTFELGNDEAARAA